MNNQKIDHQSLNDSTKVIKNTPEKELVISKDDQGKVISKFEDNQWDFYPYMITSVSSKVNFEKIPDIYREDVKRIIFYIYFKSGIGFGGLVGVSTLHSHMKPLRVIVRFCEDKMISFSDFFSSKKMLIMFLNNIDNKNNAVLFSALVSVLRLRNSINLGYAIYKDIDIQYVKQRVLEFNHKKEQHPIIPQRILSELISQSQIQVVEALTYKDKIFHLIERMSKDPGYGRSIREQQAGYKLSISSGTIKPDFNNAIKAYNLVNFCRDKDISNKTKLYEYINNIRFLCRYLLEIYSGMRVKELYSLTTNSLNKVQMDLEEYWLFSGITTKLVPGQKPTTWATSKDITGAYEFLKSFSLLVGERIGLEKSTTPLFISSEHLSRASRLFTGRVIYSSTSSRKLEIFNNNRFVINEDDLNFLYKVDPFRDWTADARFQIGKVWNFTDHQFRRSLAFYAAQSNLVSLPSLKRQLQHLTFEMTLYYSSAKNSYLSLDSKHIANLINSVSVEAEIFGFIENVLLNDDELHGPKGQFIEKKQMKITNKPKVLQKTWTETKKLVDKGMFSCKPTLFGYCTSVNSCDSSLTMKISDCIECKNAITTLPKLTKAIDSYELVVNSEPDTPEGGFNKRFGSEILDKLKSYKNKIEKRKKL